MSLFTITFESSEDNENISEHYSVSNSVTFYEIQSDSEEQSNTIPNIKRSPLPPRRKSAKSKRPIPKNSIHKGHSKRIYSRTPKPRSRMDLHDLTTPRENSQTDENDETIPFTAIEDHSNKAIIESDETHNSTTQITSPPIDPLKDFLTYRVTKEKFFTIKGNQFNFHFFLDNVPLYDTNYRFSKHNQMPIFPHSNFMNYTSSSSKNFPCLSITESNHRFILYKNSLTIPENQIMNLSFLSVSPTMPQKAQLFIEKDNTSINYASKKPKLHRTGAYMLDFHQRKAIRSIKNCILVDDNQNESILIRKETLDSLAIDSLPNIDPLYLFAIGISSMLKKK